MPTQEVFDKKDGAVYTTSNGAPVAEPYAAQRAGLHGPLLLQGAIVERTQIYVSHRRTRLPPHRLARPFR